MTRNPLLLFACSMLFAAFAHAQPAATQWRAHLPYNQTRHISLHKGRIFVASYHAGFYFDPATGELKRMSKVNGLSDVGISAVGSLGSGQGLYIGYTNGNLDIISNGETVNFSLIKSTVLPSGKRLNHFSDNDGEVWISTDFGIVVFDPQRIEIRETYKIGAAGAAVKVYQTAHSTSHHYAATAAGLLAAPTGALNLMDFQNWQQLTGLPTGEVLGTAVFQGNVFALVASETDASGLYRLVADGQWELFSAVGEPRHVTVQQDYLLLVGKTETQTWDENLQLYRSFSDYGFDGPNMYDALLANNGDLFIADNYFGLIRAHEDGNAGVIRPNAPPHKQVTDIVSDGGVVYAAGGSRQNRWQNLGMYYFKDEKWNGINQFSDPGLKNVKNIDVLALDPLRPGHFYGGSWGFGLAEFQGFGLKNVYDESTPGSLIEPVSGYGSGYALISGLTFDTHGTLWLANSQTSKPVISITQDGEWQEYGFSSFGFDPWTATDDLIYTENGHFWLALRDYGVLAFTADGQETYFQLRDTHNEVLNADITVLQEDKAGDIWVGTTEGIAIYYTAGSVFDYTITATRPVVGNSYLLSYDEITDIYVDGGNRKWVGTARSGVFLLSPDGKEELLHFTSENAPLPSSTITAIGADETTGEVFIATSEGMVSYRSDARTGEDTYADVYVYPNPVRHDFHGPITIDGLIANSNVKITDVAGNLVYEARSNGAVVTWDGKRTNGQRVNTGVYLVFCATEDGESAFVTKFLVIQ